MTTPIPQPPGIPLLGNIFDVDPNNTWVSLQKLWKKHGEIFKITVLGQQIVFVANVALCEEISDEKRFRKYVGGPVVEIRYSTHDCMFCAFDKEASWGIHHRILAPLITSAAIAEHFTEARDIIIELTAIWQGLGHRPVSALEQLNRLNLECTTQCLYGRRLNGLTGPEPPMIAAMDGATAEAMKRPVRPKFINWLFYQSKFKRDSNAMRKYAGDCLQYRKDNPTDRKDLLNAMINGKDPETGKGLVESQIIDEMVSMPIGSSTAPCVIAHALYYLIKNPDCVLKARGEINTVINDVTQFSYSDLEKLPYCAGIVRESLRLSAAAPGYTVEPLPGSQGPITLGGGKYQIPANQPMILVLHGVNRDPAVYEEPEAFKPERMVGEKFEQLPVGAKKFFGNGKRACFGISYAWMWLMTTVVVLLKEVDIEMKSPGYELKQYGWFNMKPIGFDIKVKARAK